MAGSSPNWSVGHVATATEWNALWASKMDVAGGALTGKIYAPYGLSLSATDAASLPFLSGTQTITGRTSSSVFNPVNLLQITEDEILSNAGGIVEGFWVQLNTSGGSKGGRTALEADMTITGPTTNTQGQYVGGQFNFLGQGSDPGIGYGANITSQLFNGTGWTGVVGLEIDLGLQTGTTAQYVTGLSVVPFGNWTIAGSLGVDSALVFGTQRGAGEANWDILIRMSGLVAGGLPLKTTGKIFAVTTTGTIATGFDFTNLTITGNVLKYGDFSLAGATGILAAAALTVQAAANANLIKLVTAATGNAPNLYTQGSDTNVGFNLNTQGTGNYVFRTNGGNNTGFQITGSTTNDGWIATVAGIAASAVNQIYGNGSANNILIGGPLGGAAQATNLTTGYMMIPFCAGPPTGVPINNGKGIALHYDSTNNQIYAYNGAWRKTVALT